MDGEADFYLASMEDVNLAEPRKCWRVKRLRSKHRDDFLLIRLEPPLEHSVYSRYGLSKTTNLVAIVPRLQGYSLFPINEWPVFVSVCPVVRGEPEEVEILHLGDFINLTWAEIYPDYLSAKRKEMNIVQD